VPEAGTAREPSGTGCRQLCFRGASSRRARASACSASCRCPCRHRHASGAARGGCRWSLRLPRQNKSCSTARATAGETSSSCLIQSLRWIASWKKWISASSASSHPERETPSCQITPPMTPPDRSTPRPSTRPDRPPTSPIRSAPRTRPTPQTPRHPHRRAPTAAGHRDTGQRSGIPGARAQWRRTGRARRAVPTAAPPRSPHRQPGPADAPPTGPSPAAGRSATPPTTGSGPLCAATPMRPPPTCPQHPGWSARPSRNLLAAWAQDGSATADRRPDEHRDEQCRSVVSHHRVRPDPRRRRPDVPNVVVPGAHFREQSFAMEGRSSFTAETVALQRAFESARPPGQRLFSDPYAVEFLRPELRVLATAARVRLLRWLAVGLYDIVAGRAPDLRRLRAPGRSTTRSETPSGRASSVCCWARAST
jgi:hypothetical protein